MEPVILSCGHVELAGGGCATVGCENEQKTSRMMEWLSMLAIAVLLLWVRWETGRGAIDIIMDNLPSLF